MKLKLATLLLSLTFCMGAFAYGNSSKPQSQDQAQGQGQLQGQNQGQSLHNQNILKAAAMSQATGQATVDLNNKNVNLNGNANKNTNDNSNRVSNDTDVRTNSYSEGSRSSSNSGALSESKSRAGDNTNNITIEGDNTVYPAASAIAGTSTPCTDALAAQAVKGGISLGGESPDCKALRTAQAYFTLATAFKDTPEGEDYLKKGHYYANRAGVSGFELGIKRVRNVVVDIAILALPFILL